MTDTGDALLRRVLEEPECDSVRLVYADWLDETGAGGKERGGFIRFQLDDSHHAAMEDTGDRFVEYEDEFDLWPYQSWPDSAETLFGGGDPKANGVWFRWRRGFIDRVECPLTVFLQRAAALFAAHPIEHVTISDMPIFPSGGNDTYYVGGLGRFPREYWSRLDNCRSERAVREGLSAVAVDLGRALAGLPPLDRPADRLTSKGGVRWTRKTC